MIHSMKKGSNLKKQVEENMVLVAMNQKLVFSNLGSKFPYVFRVVYNFHVNYHNKGSENTLRAKINPFMVIIDLLHIFNKKLNCQSSAHDVLLKFPSPPLLPITSSLI